MGFMKLLRSLEEALYEVASWLVFYPLTLLRTLAHPIALMAYAERELSDKAEEQYDDALSPPIFLLLTLLLVHVAADALKPGNESALPASLSSDNNLLAFRAILFSVFPLLQAVVRLRIRGVKLKRSTLQPSFYSQCYVAAPLVIGTSLGLLLLELPGGMSVGLPILVAALVWYIVVQAFWLARTTALSEVRAALVSIATVLTGLIMALGAATGTALLLRSSG